MKILSDAEDNKDIPSLEIVRELISEVVAKAVPCDNEVITENYKLGTDVQTALSNLLTYTYVNASGIGQLSTSLQNAWNAINTIPDYTGGSGIVVSGSVIGHSNNLTAEGTVNTGAIQTPDFGENATLAWFKYDKQGHVTFTGTGGITIPTADKTLSSTSTRPISSKAVYDNLTASVIRATAKTVGSGEATTAIYENVQKTLEGFQSHIYKLHTDITSLGSNVGALNTYKDSINISAGSTTVPVYFNNGVPTICKYTLGSICTKSTGDYLPITGGTLTGKLTVNSDVVIPNSKAVADNTVPVAGSLATITNKDFTQLKNYKSIIGSVNNPTNGSWYNVISVRHRNGYNDGSNYGMYIYSNLTSSGSLIWNKQTAASTWQGERTILDSGNYTSYFVVDSKLNTGSTNAIQNKVVATEINSVKSALDATNSVVGDLANNLQGAYNKFANYLPLSGGTVTGKTTFSGGINVKGADLTGGTTGTSTIVGFMSFKNDNSSSSPKYPYTGFYQWGSQWQVNARNSENTYVHNLLTIDNETKAATFSGSVTAPSFVGNATSASRLVTSLVTIQTGSTKKAKITLETLMNWLITKGYIPSDTNCYRTITTGWSYDGNDILRLTTKTAVGTTNYELQLAGVAIEFVGFATSYNSGVFRLRIHSAPTTDNFTLTSGYNRFPVSHIAEYYCNGSVYSPTWKVLSSMGDSEAYNVTQSNTVTSNYRPILMGYNNSTDASTLTTTVTNQVMASSSIYAQPSTGTLYASKYNGYKVEGTSGNWFSSISVIRNDGVMEAGKYIDFHTTNTGTTDYDVRLTAGSGTLTCSGSITATSFSGNASSATKWATARNINGLSVDGTANRVNYGTCSTAAATAAKVVACTGFALVTGAEITVKFTVTNTASSPTLNVNSTGAKAIYYRGSAISAGYLAANRTYTFRYNGTQYELVGDINTNTDTNVTQNNTTEGYDYRLLLSNGPNDNNDTNIARKSTNFYANPSTGVLTSKYFNTTSGGKLLASSDCDGANSTFTITIADLTKYSHLLIRFWSMGIPSASQYAFSEIIPVQYLVKNPNTYIAVGSVLKSVTGSTSGLFDNSGIEIAYTSGNNLALKTSSYCSGVGYDIYSL